MNRILNCIPSHTEKNWTCRYPVTLEKDILPISVDLRRDWWKISDQGETGSCVGQATVDSVLRWMFVTAQKINYTQRLSVRQVWVSAKETDEYTDYPTTFIEAEGTSLKAALEIARNFGVVKEEVFSFDDDNYKGNLVDFYTEAAKLRISSYYQLVSLDQVRQWLAKHGPIPTCLQVDDNFMNCNHTGEITEYNANNILGGHAIAIVGYTVDSLILRNSWGEGWGDKGYAYVPYSYFENFLECYGVVV
jgi:C1A family cysteine protease